MAIHYVKDGERPNRFTQDDRVEVMFMQQGDIHLHDHAFLEMVYVTSGQALHTLNDTETVVKKGDYFIINYGAKHKYTLIDDQPFNLINILFKPELIDKSLQNCRSFLDFINHYLIRINYATLIKNPTSVIYHDDKGLISTLVEKIAYEYDRRRPGYIELIRCHIIEIIIHTLRTVGKRDSGAAPDNPSSYIKEYIEKHYMEPITLSQLSEELNFSLQYLCRRFKKDTGFTFMGYLQRQRMEQSGRLLANTDKKLSEIAELVGYQDAKFFSGVFKNYWGVTPSAFRKSYR